LSFCASSPTKKIRSPLWTRRIVDQLGSDMSGNHFDDEKRMSGPLENPYNSMQRKHSVCSNEDWS
jgi:hypothetical protein